MGPFPARLIYAAPDERSEAMTSDNDAPHTELAAEMTRDLLAMTADNVRVREMLAEAWHIGYVAAAGGWAVNPFAVDGLR